MYQWCISVEGQETSAVLDPAIGMEARTLFVAGHGAGSDMNHSSMLKLSEVLRGRGVDVVRFNFLYREKGVRAPDRMPKLQACFTAVANRARDSVGAKKLLIGGRSMGGRVASMLAAEGFECDGLLLLAYPLHPNGQPKRLRDQHLPRITAPVLCINGTRDKLCERPLMERALESVKTRWEMKWLEGKDHSFPITDEVGELAARWLAGL
ncbi:MAG TPA: alpha/beta family hydrolase [Burkholderiales bacterium]|nr:alpha/beta family hydrolase [Burkholderiales bacterium]